MYARLAKGVNNTLELMQCNFTNNYAIIEAGVGRISFWDDGSSGKLIVDSCYFRNNSGGIWAPILGGVFVLTTKTDFVATTDFGRLEKQVFISNSIFTENIAGVGSVFYLQHVNIQLENW